MATKMANLEDLYMDLLKDLYSAEKQLVKALPKMAKTAKSEELRMAFERHLEQTREHANRIEQVCEELGVSPKGKKCVGMEGLIEEGKEVMKEDLDMDTLDAGLIGAAQKAMANSGSAWVQPVAIAYTRMQGLPIGRQHRPQVAWYGGADLVPHLKRLMGRGLADVQDELNVFPFRIAADSENVIRVELGEKTYTPPEISARILREHRGPNVPWALVLLFGFAMWVSGAFAFAVRAIDACLSSSIDPITTAAPNCFASRQTASNFSSPSSKFVELMMHLPPACSSAARIVAN